MSSKAVGWAIEQDARGNDKLVLILLAEAHRVESGMAFPSTAWLVDHTGLDRKTVIRCMDRLEAAGLIVDTGQRVGKTNQIKCYNLSLPKTAPLPAKAPAFPTKAPKNGTRNLESNNTSRAKALSVSRDAPSAIKDGLITADTAANWAVAEMGWRRPEAIGEWLRFADNCKAHGRTYKDWMAAWRNWCRSPYCKTVSPAAAAVAYRKEPLRV